MRRRAKIGKGISGFGLFLFLTLWSCNQPTPKARPELVISPEKMADFLYAIHEQESRLLTSGIRQDTAYLLFDSLQKRIQKQFGLDSAALQANLNYYSQHVELLDSIYKTLEKRVNLKMDSLQTNPL